MDVILLERIEKLGQMGDTVHVKAGFARNYLLPQRKALRATKENLARFETERARLEAANLQRRGEAEAVAGKMAGLSVTLLRQASEAAQLYGSVNARDIAQAITEAGFAIERQQVRLDHPIKTLGLHGVKVSLHPEVALEIQVNVARSAAEAEIQAAGGTVNREAFFDEPEEVEELSAEGDEAEGSEDEAPTA